MWSKQLSGTLPHRRRAPKFRDIALNANKYSTHYWEVEKVIRTIFFFLDNFLYDNIPSSTTIDLSNNNLSGTILVTPLANPTSTKYERDVGFIRGDLHLNWQDAFCDIWAPQEQNRAGLVKVQSRQYHVRSGLGHDRWYQNGSACPLEQ